MFLLDWNKEFISAPGGHLIYQFVSDGVYLPKSWTDYNSLGDDKKKKKLVGHNSLIPQVDLIAAGWSHNSHHKLHSNCAMNKPPSILLWKEVTFHAEIH